ncbi:MAG: uroporphyrinogen decarboxylase family protein [Spirochaetia bacterium]
MTNRERVLASLSHRQPDRIPFHIQFTEPARAKMAAYYGDPDFEGKLGNCLHVLGTEPAGAWREVRAGIWEDQFGVQWDRSIDRDIGNVCNVTVTRDTLGAFRFPDPDDPTRFADHARLIAENPREFHVTNLGFSLFERAWTLAGMETFLMAMVDDKEFAHALLDRILEYNLRIIDKACALPIDAMMFGDDWGQQRGLIMGAALWREFIGPRVRTMYARVKSRGKRVFIHSCGKVDELFRDLIESGLDVFNPFQPEVIDVEEAKRRYGDRLSFYGGISTQKTLPYGSTSDVKDEVRRLLERIGKNGGYIASPAHDVPRDAKPENIAAMIDTLQSQ